MKQNDIQFLFDYNDWANAKILAACARVTPEQFAAPAGLSHGSLRATLVHALNAEVIWRQRCLGKSPSTTAPVDDQFVTIEALAAVWREEEKTLRAYLCTLTDEMLNQTVAYMTTRGVPFENTLWQLLAHVVNHGTQCRSEAGMALTAYGQSPGDLDMLYFFRR